MFRIFALTGCAFLAQPSMIRDAQPPVALRIDTQPDFLDIVVVSDSEQSRGATFELEVSSSGRGGTTKTKQSGESRGRPGEVLLTSRIRTTGLTAWKARMRVMFNGREYVVVKSS